MTICPQCELPIRDGDKVRMEVLAYYRQESPVSHGVSVYQEEWVEHIECGLKD